MHIQASLSTRLLTQWLPKACRLEPGCLSWTQHPGTLDGRPLLPSVPCHYARLSPTQTRGCLWMDLSIGCVLCLGSPGWPLVFKGGTLREDFSGHSLKRPPPTQTHRSLSPHSAPLTPESTFLLGIILPGPSSGSSTSMWTPGAGWPAFMLTAVPSVALPGPLRTSAGTAP